MGETAKQVEHEVKGMVEKAAGAVTASDGLEEKGEAHLDEAAKLDEAFEKSRAGTRKDSTGRGSLENKP